LANSVKEHPTDRENIVHKMACSIQENGRMAYNMDRDRRNGKMGHNLLATTLMVQKLVLDNSFSQMVVGKTLLTIVIIRYEGSVVDNQITGKGIYKWADGR
jgi:hypothetical protein